MSTDAPKFDLKKAVSAGITAKAKCDDSFRACGSKPASLTLHEWREEWFLQSCPKHAPELAPPDVKE